MTCLAQSRDLPLRRVAARPHKFYKPTENPYRRPKSPSSRRAGKIPRKPANPAAHNSTGRREKGKEGNKNEGKRSHAGADRAEEINQNRPFGRNSAKSGKIESGRKSGRQRDDDDEEDAPGRSSRRVRSRRTSKHEPGLLRRGRRKRSSSVGPRE